MLKWKINSFATLCKYVLSKLRRKDFENAQRIMNIRERNRLSSSHLPTSIQDLIARKGEWERVEGGGRGGRRMNETEGRQKNGSSRIITKELKNE